jgi:hypothetical protein
MMLPEAWETLDFDPATRERSIEQLVRRAVGKADSLLLHQWAVNTYRHVLDHAASTGMFFGANFAGEIAGRPLSASVLAFVTHAPVDNRGRTMEPALLAQALAHPYDERPIEPPRLVDLPVGPSVRTRARVGPALRIHDRVSSTVSIYSGVGVSEHDAAAPEPEEDVVRFYTAVPEWDLLLVIAFSTPVLAAAEAFAELFDSIAITAQWKD